MDEPLDELYFTWLYSQVASLRVKNPSRTYWSLFRQLYRKEFVWIIPNDDNRVEDGRDLRYEFIDTRDVETIDLDPDWMNLGCSFLEMLVGLSRRLEFETDTRARDWFWRLIENLDLARFNDAYGKRLDPAVYEDEIDYIADTVIYRLYEPDGRGGLFPLRNADEDQTEIEIWYQLCAYLLENQ